MKELVELWSWEEIRKATKEGQFDNVSLEEKFDVIEMSMNNITKAIGMLIPLVEEYYRNAVAQEEEIKGVEKSLLAIERRKGLIRGVLGGDLHFYSKQFRKGGAYVV